MLLRLRLRVADRPGALGQVTRELGASGADIVQVSVLNREQGRALDEITVFLPDQNRRPALENALRGLGGVTVEGIRPCTEVPGAFPDLDLLGRIAADPRASLNLLADALPRILAADWALVLSPDHGNAVLARSWSAPAEPVLPELPAQAGSITVGAAHYATAPVGGSGVNVLVCRLGDPGFHRFETMRLTRLAEVTSAVAGARLLPRGGAAVRGAERPALSIPTSAEGC
jgi:hypothetical protein